MPQKPEEEQPLRIEVRFDQNTLRDYLKITRLGDLLDSEEQTSTRLQVLLQEQLQDFISDKEAVPLENLHPGNLSTPLLWLQLASNPDLAAWLRSCLNTFGVWHTPKPFAPRKIALLVEAIGSSGSILQLPTEDSSQKKEERQSA